ncbi:MFS transporter [Cuniculiplasma sp. SKW3]|uniref:MFS transporter n=1 Tax=Cuniculiplasma sp. SKW3 TaxID=3400170 RepID=UPI003FD34EEF
MKSKIQLDILIIDSVVNGFSKYPLWILLSLYLNGRGFNFIDIGIILVLSNIISSPFLRKSGKMVDKFGRRRFTYILPLFLLIAYSFLYVTVLFNFSIIFIFGLLTLISYLSSFESTLKNTMITDLSLENERSRYFSIMRIWANVGIGIGLVCSGIASIISYSIFFLAPIFGSIFQFILFLYFFQETVEVHKRQEYTKQQVKINGQYGRIIMVSTLISICFAISNQYETPAMPLYLSTQWLLNPVYITILYSVNTMVVVFFQSKITSLAIRFKEYKVFSYGILFYSLSFFIFSITGNIFLLALAIVILTIGENLMSPVSSSIISKIAPEDQRGEYFGINSLIYNIVTPVSLFLGIILLQIFSSHEVFAMYSLSMLSALTFFFAYAYLGKITKTGSNLQMAHN